MPALNAVLPDRFGIVPHEIIAIYGNQVEAFLLIKHYRAGGSVDDIEAAKSDNKKKGKIMDAIFSFIGGTFSPCIPVLVAGGLTGAVLTLLTNFCGVTADSGTYQVFYAINQAAFYFLPIFVGFAAASRLKCNGYLGAFLAAILTILRIPYPTS